MDPDVEAWLGSLKGASLNKVLFGTPSQPRRSTVLFDLSPDQTLGTFSDSFRNLETAVLTRVLLHKDKNGNWRPTPEHIPNVSAYRSEFRLFFESVVDKALTEEGFQRPMSRTEYADVYPGQKRQIYLQAAQSLEEQDLKRSDSDIKGFLKFEKDIRSSKPDRIPRVISPPGPRYRLETGRYVRPAEKVLYKAIEEVFGFPVISKGRNYEEVGSIIAQHWDSFPDPRAVDMDVSKMDKNTTWGVPFTNALITSLFEAGDRDVLTQWLSWQENYKATISCREGLINYRSGMSLASGQVNTSLVGVSQVLALVWTFNKKHGLRLKIINSGDDFTLIGTHKDVAFAKNNLPRYFERWGFDLETGSVVSRIEHIEFCQTHPMKIGGVWTMVRDPRVVAMKDACSLYPLDSEKEVYAHMNSVGKGGLASFGGVPILQSFYSALVRESENAKARFKLTKRQSKRWDKLAYDKSKMKEDGSLKWFGDGMKRAQTSIHPDDRVGFQDAFDISAPYQEVIESYYDSWRYTPGVEPIILNTPIQLF